MTSIDLMTFTPSPPEDLNNDATENDFRDLALVQSDDNESEDDAHESNYDTVGPPLDLLGSDFVS